MNQVKTQDELVVENIEWARKIVRRVIRGARFSSDEILDLEAAAFLDLVESASRYSEVGSGASFRTFAYLAVRGAVINEIHNLRGLKAESAAVQRSYLEEERQGFKFPEEASSLQSEFLIVLSRKLCSESKLLSSLEKSFEAEQRLVQEESSPLGQYLRREELEVLRGAVESLSERDREVLTDIYLKEIPYADLLSKYGLKTSGALSKWKNRALLNLKTYYEGSLERVLVQ